MSVLSLTKRLKISVVVCWVKIDLADILKGLKESSNVGGEDVF